MPSLKHDYLAYFGRYEIDTGRQVVRHFLEGQLFPGSHPAVLERKYRFDGDLMSLRPVDQDRSGNFVATGPMSIPLPESTSLTLIGGNGERSLFPNTRAPWTTCKSKSFPCRCPSQARFWCRSWPRPSIPAMPRTSWGKWRKPKPLEFPGATLPVGWSQATPAGKAREFLEPEGISALAGMAAMPNSWPSPWRLWLKCPRNSATSKPTAIGLEYLTAFAAIVRTGAVQQGETVLVTGTMGAVGLAAAKIAAWKGARVLGTVRSSRDLGKRNDLAMVEWIDLEARPLPESVKELTKAKEPTSFWMSSGGRFLSRVWTPSPNGGDRLPSLHWGWSGDFQSRGLLPQGSSPS